MSEYRIGSVNATNIQMGDHNTQTNTTVSTDDELTKLAATIDQHAALLPDPAAAHRALEALRVACTARPHDQNRLTRAAVALCATTAAAPPLRDEVTRLVNRITQ
ncbi:hypothetical protein [Luedemannella helvata]|uniref:Uncharacterized protein n=1 Tax=Luedemannella helvata TaxID=349315 RepID=A0ABN2JVN3_9ACTN